MTEVMWTSKPRGDLSEILVTVTVEHSQSPLTESPFLFKKVKKLLTFYHYYASLSGDQCRETALNPAPQEPLPSNSETPIHHLLDTLHLKARHDTDGVILKRVTSSISHTAKVFLVEGKAWYGKVILECLYEASVVHRVLRGRREDKVKKERGKWKQG